MLKRRLSRILLYILLALVVLVGGTVIYYKIAVNISIPEPSDLGPLQYKTDTLAADLYSCEKGWLNKSRTGLWELYVEGSPFERGVANGLLTKELIAKQEKAFVDRLRIMIPSRGYQKFLKYFVSYFNRNLDHYILPEYQLEIFGISHFVSPDYRWIGPGYIRILNYHAAHDIGHAMQNMNLVGCTAFAAWGSRSADSNLIIGRNFDFYMGDEFAAEKIVCFIHPDTGYNFMMITWGGMIGVVSGMNDQGLTVTLNAAKSSIPYGARTPVSIVAREILQYARSIKEAYKIAAKRSTFVSEAFLVGSARDGKAIVIEKSPEKISAYDPGGNTLILTNHFQSEAFTSDPLNIENKENGTSVYRYMRMEELLEQEPVIDAGVAARILRDQKGLGGENIGMGNEKAVNQLISHHSVIFEPSRLLAWVAVPPYQLGPYVCYDLKTIFSQFSKRNDKTEIIREDLTIPADTFLFSQDYQRYQSYRERSISLSANHSSLAIPGFENGIIALNPEYYQVYSLIGDYFRKTGDYQGAIKYYNLALTKEISSRYEENLIRENLEKCFKQTN
jgi:isopenicillin-N N-acyltransferase-like protein